MNSELDHGFLEMRNLRLRCDECWINASEDTRILGTITTSRGLQISKSENFLDIVFRSSAQNIYGQTINTKYWISFSEDLRDPPYVEKIEVVGELEEKSTVPKELHFELARKILQKIK